MSNYIYCYWLSAVFAIVVGLIARSRSQQLGESEAEKEVARNKAGNQAELLVNNKIQAMITHELDGHGVNHPKFIFLLIGRSNI